MRIRTTGLLLALAGVPLLGGPRAAGGPASIEQQQRPQVFHSTLYQQDFLRRTLSLNTGEYGTVLQDHQVLNLDSELDYGSYLPDGLSVGVQGGQRGDFYDLGTTAELAQRYGYQETVGGGQGFASIHFDGGTLVILRGLDGPTFQPFTEGNIYLASAPPSGIGSVPVQDGHLYLVRIVDANDPGFFRFVKLMVTSHRPSDQVTLVWQELRR